MKASRGMNFNEYIWLPTEIFPAMGQPNIWDSKQELKKKKVRVTIQDQSLEKAHDFSPVIA